MRRYAIWLNALVVMVAAVGLTFAAVGVLLVAGAAFEPGDVPPFRWFADSLKHVQALDAGNEALAIALCLVIAIAGTAIVLLELRFLLSSRLPALLISDDEMGYTTIERNLVETYLSLAALRITGIDAANVHVRPSRDGNLLVKARLNINPSSETVVPVAAKAAREAMVGTADQLLGLDIADLVVATAMRSPRSGRKPRSLELA